MQDSCWMFDSVHERDFASVSNWPLKSVDQQQSQRWRAGLMHPAGHRRSSWRITETPTGSQRTCQIKVDRPVSPVTWTTQPTVLHSQPCEFPQRAASNSAVHIVHTVHESGGPHHQEVTQQARLMFDFIFWKILKLFFFFFFRESGKTSKNKRFF